MTVYNSIEYASYDYAVDDIASKNALVGLTLGDTIFVESTAQAYLATATGNGPDATLIGGGSGSGDMEVATYDTNADGTVDSADTAAALTGAQATAITDNTSHTALTNNPHGVDAAAVGLGDVDNIPDADKPVSAATQTALNLKASTASLAAVATSGDYSDLSNAPDLSVYDEIEQHATLAAFPVTGDVNKFYLAQNTGLMYRWTGATYENISAQLALGETSATAYRGDRGKTAYDHSQVSSGNPHAVTKT